MKTASVIIVVIVVIATRRCIRGNTESEHCGKKSEDTNSGHVHLTVQLEVETSIVNRAIENTQEILRAYRT